MYEQIVDQIRRAIWSGDLPAGTSLPSLRRLARDLEVSLITTTRAYNDLAAAGLIANQAGRGSFVLPQDEAETRERLLARLDSQLDDAGLTAAGITAGTVRLSVGIEHIDDILADLERGLAAARAVGAGEPSAAAGA